MGAAKLLAGGISVPIDCFGFSVGNRISQAANHADLHAADSRPAEDLSDCASVRKNVDHGTREEQKRAQEEEAKGRLPVEPRRGIRRGRFEGGGSLDSAEAEN